MPEGSVAGRESSGAWWPFGIVNEDYFSLSADCKIKFVHVWNGSANVPTITSATFKGVEFLDASGLLYNP